MTWNSKVLPRAMALLAGLTTLGLGTRLAQAQCNIGLAVGWGGFEGFHYAASPTDYLNQRAFFKAAGAGLPATQGSIAGNPKAYYYTVRDDGFVSHYDLHFRKSPAVQSQHLGSLGVHVDRRPAVDSTAASSRPREVIPLSNFFDSSGKLVRPAEAPAEVGLTEKREIFERASLAVLEESREHGSASIATVKAARRKLLEYGRPALQQVRASATPRVADKFHLFLLSLYDSLVRSAAPEFRPSSASKPAADGAG